MALNLFVANGNLGKDPEYKVSQSGNGIVRFSLAVKGNRKDDNGEYKTNWINCLAFGKTAELITNHCKKGDKIGIRGSLETGSYTNNENKTVYTTDIIVQEIEFLTSKQQNGQVQQQHSIQQPMNPQFVQQQQQQQFQQQPQYQQQMSPQQAQQFTQQMGAQVIDQSDLPF